MTEPVQATPAEAFRQCDTQKRTGRTCNYDHLRVFAMFMVILNHIADVYYIAFLEEPSKTVYFYEGLSHCAVPLFLMLTGVFTLRKAGKVSPKEFYLHSAKKLGIPLLVFTVLYYLYDVLVYGVDLTYILQTLSTGFCGIFAHWYVVMLAVVYAFLPLVAFVKKQVPYEKYEKAAVLLFLWLMLSNHVESTSTTWSLSNLHHMGYVLIGDVIATRLQNRKHNLLGTLLILLGLAVQACNHLTILNATLTGNDFLYSLLFNYYASPLIILGSLLIFAGFSMLELKRNISVIAGASYTVFLCHKLIINLFLNHTSAFSMIEDWCGQNIAIIIPVDVILLFLISFAFSLAFDHLLNKTVFRPTARK